MLFSTRGIVLRQVKYSETSVILTVFTEEFGLKGFIHKGARKTKYRNAITPLAIVQIQFSGKAHSQLSYVREIIADPPYHGIAANMLKSSVVVFLNEALLKVLREESSSPQLYRFLERGLRAFDELPFNPNFHIWLLLGLSHQLGFGPQIDAAESLYFDLEQGKDAQQQPNGVHLFGNQNDLFRALLVADFNESCHIKMTRDERQQLLNHIITYFSIHVGEMANLNSRAVLETVFEG